MGAVPQRDADLLHLWVAYQSAAKPAAKAAALAKLDAEIDRRRATDSSIRAAVWNLLQQPAVLVQLQVCNDWHENHSRFPTFCTGRALYYI